MAEPLLYRERLIGVISIDSEKPGGGFTQEDWQLLRLFADQAAIAIANAQLFQAQQAAYTDLERAQEELVRAEKLRALGQLAAGVAHDLNNTLAAVLGQAELLRLGDLDTGAQEALQTLELAATDGALIVRRLQDFARQRASEALAPCDLGEVVRQALDFTRPQWKDAAERQGRRIAIRLEVPALPPVLGDPSSLREALANLLLNAVDAMPQGGTLRIGAREISPPDATDADRWVELTVEDTGVGMPEEVRRRIFEPFFTTKGVRGTGLGLSVVYGILERHGGRIAVASTPGAGTVFTCHVRVAPENATRAVASRTPLVSTPQRLLLIDDEPLVRSTLATMLRTAGHTVHEAADGPAGLAHLSAATVDLVFTDLGMPEMTGTEVAAAVKARHPHMPVVLLTGWGEHGAGAPTACNGIDRLLGKPVRLSDLLAAVADLCPNRGDAWPAQ
jgi:signal transduction histidine kinase/ActR/RegA family two-component response regulator